MARIVVITGANRGLGRGIAEAFHARGDVVVGLNRTLCGENWLREIPCDLRDSEAIRKAVAAVAGDLGGIDVVVSNAGIRRFGPVDEISPEDWEESLTVNLRAPFYLTQAAASHLIQAKGLLVYVGSHAGLYPFEGGAAYCVTKAALHALAEVALLDLRHRGVRVVTLAPGAIANRPLPDDEWKIRPRDIGELLVGLADLPASMIPTQVRVSPSRPKKLPFRGIDVLQYM